MKYTTKSYLATNLKKYRKLTGLTQAAVADALGIERSRYAHYESGTTPSAENLRKLAVIFKVTIDELLGAPANVNNLNEVVVSNSIESFRFNELKNDEKSLIIKFRLLSAEAKTDIVKALEDKIDKSEE